MKLVAGLGNPGETYVDTRHNVGFRAVDRLATDAGLRWRRSWFGRARKARWKSKYEAVWLIKPVTFMNRSGLAIDYFLKKYSMRPDDLIVIYDDLDLELGRIRIRPRGSAGGHNGMKSVIGAIGDDAFTRIRLGIGQADRAGSVIDFVLSPFSDDEQKAVDGMLKRAAAAVQGILDDGVEIAMNRFNG